MPLLLGVNVVVVADLLAFLVLLAGVGPSISATSSRLLLDPPLASLDLPCLSGCLFPVISLLNGIVGHLKLWHNLSVMSLCVGLNPLSMHHIR